MTIQDSHEIIDLKRENECLKRQLAEADELIRLLHKQRVDVRMDDCGSVHLEDDILEG